MEKDCQLASRKFWQTVRRLRKGKQGLIQAVLCWGGELLTQTEDIVGWWNKHFEELLNLTSEEEADVTEVVKKLFIGKAPGEDEIRPEMLKALNIVGLSWLTRILSVAGRRPVEWQTRVVDPFSRRRTVGCVPIIRESHCSGSPGKFIPGCWKGGSGRLSNLSFRRNNVESVLAVELWTSSLHLHVGHLPDAFIQNDFQRVHFLKETAIYNCGT